MLDLGPQAAVVKEVVAGIGDDQLDAPTPCEGTPVGGLLDHLAGLAEAFRRAAEKDPLPRPPGIGDSSRPAEDLRTRIPAQLDALAAAWRRPEAWEGMTEAGGVQMPAPVAAAVALNEVLVHGWDLAVATGQGYRADPVSVEACMTFVAPTADEPPQPGLFGPPVPVPDGAPPLDRLLGLTGRDPGWPTA
jgi:uncharacterized protein (TIGR03086 family)